MSEDKSGAVIRLGMLVATLAMHMGLGVWVFGDAKGQSIQDTVLFGCLTVLGAGLYTGLYALLRRRSSVMLRMPALTIRNIWAYVYGVGILGFTMLYCFNGANLMCACCVFTSLAQVDAADRYFRRWKNSKIQKFKKIKNFEFRRKGRDQTLPPTLHPRPGA
jgi:hypothetical protein